jgi:hypothetical protein
MFALTLYLAKIWEFLAALARSCFKFQGKWCIPATGPSPPMSSWTAFLDGATRVEAHVIIDGGVGSATADGQGGTGEGVRRSVAYCPHDLQVCVSTL